MDRIQYTLLDYSCSNVMMQYRILTVPICIAYHLDSVAEHYFAFKFFTFVIYSQNLYVKPLKGIFE